MALEGGRDRLVKHTGRGDSETQVKHIRAGQVITREGRTGAEHYGW